MYADKGDLVNAQRCLEEALKIQGNETSIKYADYAQTLTYLGWLYSSMSKEEEAETVHKLALEIRKEVFGERHPYYAQSLNAVAGILTDKKEYVKAEQFYEQARIIRKEAYGEEHSFYANIINNLGRIYLILKDYRKAESFFLEVMSIRKKVFGENHPEYANILNSLAILYKNMKEYDKAEKYYLEALSIRKKVLGENHPEYTNILNSLAIIYDNMKEYGKAKEYYLEELSIRKRVFGENHSDYANVLNSLGIIYQNLKEYQKAETVYLEALLVRKKVHGENHVDYATVLFNLSNLYKLMKEYARAEMSCLQVLSIRKQVLGENHPDYARAHKFIGLLYLDMGKYSNAEQSLYEAKNIFDRIHGRYNYESHLLNKSLVSYYFNVGKHSRAEVLILESLETIKNLKGDISLDYAYVLRELIHFNTAMGQYDKALKHYETQRRIVNINKAQIRDVDYYYLLLTEGLTVYANNGKNNEAEEIGKEVVSLSKKLFGDSSYNYAVSLADLSKLYIYKFGLRYYPKGEELLIDALKVFEKHFGENSPRYCSYERELAILYYLQGKFDFAEAIFDKLNKRSVELWGDLGPNRIDILKRMAELYAVKREFDKAGRYQLKAAEKEFSYMLSDFVNLSEAEKTKYLNRIDINEKTNSLIYNNPGASSEIKESGFNFQLLFKSFILADTRNIIESIERGTDTILKRTYRKWKDGKAFIAQQYSLPESKRVANLKMVIDETELAEKELNRNSSSFRRQQQAMQVKIQDVADALKSDEAAIEFVKFSLFNKKWKDTAFVYSDSVIYAAYVLTKRISTPVFVPLFEEKQLQKLFDSAGTSSDAMVSKFYRGVELGNTGTAASLGKDLYNLVWAPLEPYLKGIKKISYSPAGKLYSIAFHALPVDSNKMLMDKYELNQYTSTRQVALRKKQEENRKPQSISLFGDARFTMDSTTIAQSKTNNTVSDIYTPPNRGNRGNNWTDLPGTAEEVKKIKQLFEQNKISTKSFTQRAASEENLKALSGNSPQILHIATHGFFLPEPDRKRKENFSSNDNSYTLADDPLLRTGLILSGGNYAWSGKTPIEGVEDGIATAYEISQLNLSNTELVVLSACETALGDVKGSEGVFGLQRAFKMAGVKKMIVSLWQVPDKETAELMTAFYGYWLKGKTIEQAFTQAQAEMRKKYSPYYWAAFVLVE